MKKGVVLVIVIGIMILISIFAWVAMQIMTQQAFVAENKIKRMRFYYAARAGLVRSLERLRRGEVPDNRTIGAGLAGYGSGIQYNVTVSSPVDGIQNVTVNVTY